MVIDTDCIGSCKSSNHTITTTTAPSLWHICYVQIWSWRRNSSVFFYAFGKVFHLTFYLRRCDNVVIAYWHGLDIYQILIIKYKILYALVVGTIQFVHTVSVNCVVEVFEVNFIVCSSYVKMGIFREKSVYYRILSSISINKKTERNVVIMQQKGY